MFLQKSKITSATTKTTTILTNLIDEEMINIRKMNQKNQTFSEQFYKDFNINFSYNSNKIEGNTVTLPETYDILQKNITLDKKPLKDQAEILGHSDAFNYLFTKAIDRNTELNAPLLLDIHKMIFADDEKEIKTGEFRTTDVYIGNYYPPSHNEVIPAIEQLLRTYSELSKDPNINKFALLAGFHYCYEKIHPFRDGNGRTGRLLVNFELLKNNYLPIDIKYENVNSYYQAFRTDDYEHMTSTFLQAMQSTLTLYKQQSKEYNQTNNIARPITQVDTLPCHPDTTLKKRN
jgi:Fic family protein